VEDLSLDPEKTVTRIGFPDRGKGAAAREESASAWKACSLLKSPPSAPVVKFRETYLFEKKSSLTMRAAQGPSTISLFAQKGNALRPQKSEADREGRGGCLKGNPRSPRKASRYQTGHPKSIPKVFLGKENRQRKNAKSLKNVRKKHPYFENRKAFS